MTFRTLTTPLPVSRHRRTALLFRLLLPLWVLPVLWVAGAWGAPTGLEVDGDAVDDVPGVPDDWDTVLGWTSGAPVPPTGSAQATTGLLSEGLGVSAFTSGSRDTGSVGSWGWSDSNVQQNYELLDAFGALYGLQLYFGADRYANGQDVALGFWFLQEVVGLNGDGTFTGSHVVGDVLVILDFTGGPGTVVPTVYRWDPTDPGAVGNLVDLGATGSEAEAVLNGAAACSPWPYAPKFAATCPAECAGGECFPAGSFYEGYVDLGVLGLSSCFRTMVAATRDDAAPESGLRDLILGSLVTGPEAAVDTVCLGESLCVQVTGGVAPYGYAWSSGETTDCIVPGTAGTYTVTVTDANGCTDTAEGTVLQTPAVTVDPVCQWRTLCPHLTGGVGPYGYAWSSGETTDCITPGTAGTYTVTVTDGNGCTVTAEGEVYAVPYPNVGPTCLGNPLCTNVTTGLAPYDYAWSTGETTDCIVPGVTGTYTVTVTDARGCTASQAGSVTLPPTVELPAEVCESGQKICLVAYGGSPPYSFLWNTGATTSCITPDTLGTYILTLTDQANCQVVDTLLVHGPLVAFPESTVCVLDTLCVVASHGTPPYTYQWNTGATTDCLSSALEGTYTVTVTDAEGCSITGEGQVVCCGTPTPSVSITGRCPGDSACAVGSGGTPPYTYLWSTGETTACIFPLSPGTYSVTLTDAESCRGFAKVYFCRSVFKVPSRYATIQAALDSAAVGDTVLVAPGAYTGSANRNLDFLGKDMVLMSEAGAENTVIDCEGSGSGIIFDDDETIDAVVQGFTIRNAAESGITCYLADPTIRDCILSQNNSSTVGGGARFTYSTATLENVRVEGNYAVDGGGGVYIQAGTVAPSVVDVLKVTGNSSGSVGGGLMIVGEGIVDHALITGNEAATLGGGVYADLQVFRFPRLRYCTLAGNRSATGGGFAIKPEVGPASGILYVDRCIVWGNEADGPTDEAFIGQTIGVTFGCSVIDSSGVHGDGIIDFGANPVYSDPFFCAPEPAANAPTPAGDYGLQVNSPARLELSPCNFQIGAEGVCEAQIGIEPGPSLPAAVRLLPAVPNPSSGRVRIGFELPVASRVSLRVFDIGGRQVRTLLEGAPYPAGRHDAVWTGEDGTGRRVAAGIYFYRLETPLVRATRKLLLIR